MEGKAVSGGELLKTDLTQVQLVSMRRSRDVGAGETFHNTRDGDGGLDVEGTVNDTITVLTEPFHELQGTVVNEGVGRRGSKNNVGRGEEGVAKGVGGRPSVNV
jgi:hypothetical protein